MGIIMDSSILIEAERGTLNIDEFINGREEEPFSLSVITIAELLHGVHRADSSARRIKRSAYVEKIIELFPVYPFDISAARIYAALWAKLRKQGIQIGAHDLMIGSTALALGFSVATFNNKHFDEIEGLRVEIPKAQNL
jgi:tRNA(fMet)-specific endonuclease VapC